MITKLFIGGISEMDEMELAQLTGPFGDIVTLKIVRDKTTRKSKGYAFIEMANREAAKLAINALDGKTVFGKELTVKITEEEPAPSVPIYQKMQRSNEPAKKKRPRLMR
jgi:RNA recognition motif-containing protein